MYTVSLYVWESRSLSSLLSFSVVSDNHLLAEHDTSFSVKVPVVWEHDVGEKRVSYDREKDRTVQQRLVTGGRGGGLSKVY